MGGRGSGQHDNHRSKYQVAEVQDGEGVPVYITGATGAEKLDAIGPLLRGQLENMAYQGADVKTTLDAAATQINGILAGQ